MLMSHLPLFVLFLVASKVLSDPIQLKVGIYNEIPDLAGDGLASYKAMIEQGFNNQDHTVNAVVDSSQYSPYGDLTKYIQEDGFDMLEIDTTSLLSLVVSDQIKAMTDITGDVFPAAIEASTIAGTLYAYPTLLCGNFLIGLSPGTEDTCPLRASRTAYTLFHDTFTSCRATLLPQYPQYDRIFGGKMNDADGYYLPDLYIDGYIDVHGAGTARQAVDELLQGVVDPTICDRLKWYIGMCSNKDGSSVNKCYQDFPGSYVASSSNIYPDISGEKTMFYFGFSEKLAQILKDNPSLQAFAALSGPLGTPNRLLQYTDGLVISKKAWDEANEEKRNAMVNFIAYFTSTELRTNIALGADVNYQMRYLLQANENVYTQVAIMADQINRDLHWALETGVALPLKTFQEMSQMQATLSGQCLPDSVQYNRADTKRIREGKVDLRKGRPPSTKRSPRGGVKKEL